MSENFEINQLYNLSSANNSPNQTQDSNNKKIKASKIQPVTNFIKTNLHLSYFQPKNLSTLIFLIVLKLKMEGKS